MFLNYPSVFFLIKFFFYFLRFYLLLSFRLLDSRYEFRKLSFTVLFF
nr:MAG TPA: hypothetical protein [Bacteriophage sp.]